MSYPDGFALDSTLIVEPLELPVSLADAKRQCRVDHGHEDDYILSLIETATGHYQRASGRAFVTQTWLTSYDAFCDQLWLPYRPVQSITSVAYYDSNNAQQIVAPSVYSLYSSNYGPYVGLLSGQVWPASYDRTDAAAVTYVAGYGNPQDVPAEIKQAILLMVSTLYEQREVLVLGQTVQNTQIDQILLSTHRVMFV